MTHPQLFYSHYSFFFVLFFQNSSKTCFFSCTTIWYCCWYYFQCEKSSFYLIVSVCFHQLSMRMHCLHLCIHLPFVKWLLSIYAINYYVFDTNAFSRWENIQLSFRDFITNVWLLFFICALFCVYWAMEKQSVKKLPNINVSMRMIFVKSAFIYGYTLRSVDYQQTPLLFFGQITTYQFFRCSFAFFSFCSFDCWCVSNDSNSCASCWILSHFWSIPNQK